MIRKSIIFTIFLLICWSIFVNHKPFSSFQHQLQDNIIRAEIFLFDIDSIDNLIVGSSLAQRLSMDSLPNFYNLSLGGQGIFDGLNILRGKKDLPKNIFVEINVLTRSEDSNFKEIISSPILNSLKRSFTIFRADKQPLTYPIYIAKKIRNRNEVSKMNSENVANNTLFDKMLSLQKGIYSSIVDSLKMNRHFEILRNHVNFLESNRVKVIFFEMPVNPQLVELNRAKYLRERIKIDFPSNHIIMLPDNILTYKTTDGVHLTNEESYIYTNYFSNEVNTVANKVL